MRRGLAAFLAVVCIGTLGYSILGLSLFDAFYMTVVTVSTVGFSELGDPDQIDTAYRVFTVVLLLLGVGTALYTLSVTLETLLESRLTDRYRRRRMTREITDMHDHVIVCGYGRIGRTVASRLAAAGEDVVIIDFDPDQLAGCPHHHILGDATDDDVLQAAQIATASTLITATSADADNLYVTLSARTLRPDLFIISRARLTAAEPKMLQAGANRVVNPQLIGGERIAALTLQPHVAEFLDVVMHEGGIEFRLFEIAVSERSTLAGTTLRESHLRDRTGALVLAIRGSDGVFHTNPQPESIIAGGSMLIAIGTNDQLEALAAIAGENTVG